MIRSFLKASALIFMLFSNASAAAPTFVFTAIPDQDETRLVERFSRFAQHLDGRLGIPVKYVPVKTYPAAVPAFTNNDVQLAWFGGFTGFQARRAVPGSEAIKARYGCLSADSRRSSFHAGGRLVARPSP